MKILLFCAAMMAVVFGDDEQHPHEFIDNCQREAFRSESVNQNDGDDAHHINDVAIVHKFEMASGNCAKAQFGYNFDSAANETAAIWSHGCSGLFNLDFLVAHCDDVNLDSTTADGDYVIHELERPCVNAAVYKMTLVKNEDAAGRCTLGDSFGFKNRESSSSGQVKAMIWADNGCKAKFHVCEISHEMEEDHMEHVDHDHE